MAMRICVLDSSSPATEVRVWEPAGPDVLVCGSGGGPGAARMLHGVDRLLLIHRETDRAAAAVVANVISGALPGAVVVRLGTRASLLAAAIVSLEAIRSSGVDDIAVVSLIERTLAVTVSGIWTRKVTRLSKPSPSFLHHLRSIFPGGPGFVSVFGEQGKVVKARPGSLSVPVARGQIVIGAGPQERGLAHLQAAYAVVGAPAVGPPVAPIVSSVGRLYGNDGMEFVMLADAMSEPAPAVGRCPVCRLPVRSVSCPFCHVVPRATEVIRP